MLLCMGDYVAINKALWDERAVAHAASADYGFDRFIGDPEYLSAVVRFDRPRLGELLGCVACTCNATSVRTPCPSPAWALG